MDGSLRNRRPRSNGRANTGSAVERFASGEVYVNHLDAEEAGRITGAYSRNDEQLVTLKNKYDPTNLFRMNQNIKPTV